MVIAITMGTEVDDVCTAYGPALICFSNTFDHRDSISLVPFYPRLVKSFC